MIGSEVGSSHLKLVLGVKSYICRVWNQSDESEFLDWKQFWNWNMSTGTEISLQDLKHVGMYMSIGYETSLLNLKYAYWIWKMCNGSETSLQDLKHVYWVWNWSAGSETSLVLPHTFITSQRLLAPVFIYKTLCTYIHATDFYHLS